MNRVGAGSVLVYLFELGATRVTSQQLNELTQLIEKLPDTVVDYPLDHNGLSMPLSLPCGIIDSVYKDGAYVYTKGAYSDPQQALLALVWRRRYMLPENVWPLLKGALSEFAQRSDVQALFAAEFSPEKLEEYIDFGEEIGQKVRGIIVLYADKENLVPVCDVSYFALLSDRR